MIMFVNCTTTTYNGHIIRKPSHPLKRLGCSTVRGCANVIHSDVAPAPAKTAARALGRKIMHKNRHDVRFILSTTHKY